MKIIIAGPSKWKGLEKRNPEEASLARQWISVQLDLALLKGEPIEAATSLHFGLDMYFASLCQAKGIPYKVFLACENQDFFLDPARKNIFKELKDNAAEVEYLTTKKYEEGCITKQRDAITNWLEGEKSLLLIVKYGGFNKSQRERKKVVKKRKDSVIKIFNFKQQQRKKRK
jgi:hypothetical protein